MAKFDISPGLTFVDRKGWGADDSILRLGHKVGRTKRTHAIIHHTVTPDTSDKSPNLWETQDEVFKMMGKLQKVRPDLGKDVPYNFVVFLMKKKESIMVCEGRGEDRSGAHTKGHNTKGVGISFAGNFMDDISDADLSSRMHLVSSFLGWLKFDPSHADYGQFDPMGNLGSLQPTQRNVFIHQDFGPTACPGSKIVKFAGLLDFIEP